MISETSFLRAYKTDQDYVSPEFYSTVMGSSEEAEKILHPISEDYMNARNAHDFEKAFTHLDPNAVVVHIGKDAAYGKEGLKHKFEEFVEKFGNVTTKFSNEHYQMSEDFAIRSGDYEISTEKAGDHKGHYTQIWRKHGDTYLMLMEEYTMDSE